MTPDQLSRRRFLTRAGLGAGGLLFAPHLLGACGGDDDTATTAATAPAGTAASAPGTEGGAAATTVRNSLGWIKNVEWAGFWRADDAGYFAQEGIEPEWIPGGPNTPPVETTVAGGAADIGTSASFSSVVEAVTKGTDLVMFGAVFQVSPGAILSLPDKPIRTAADLAEPGLKIGFQGSTIAVDTVLRLNGFETAYEQVKVGFTPDPLVQGQCDAYQCYLTNQPLSLEEQGIEHIVTTYDSMGFKAYGSVLFAGREYLEANRETLVGYLRASIMGWEINEADPAIAAQLSVDEYGQDLGLSLDQQIAENNAQIPLTKSDLTAEKGLLWVDKATVAGPMFEGLTASGMTNLPDVDAFVDTTLLEEAYAGATRLT